MTALRVGASAAVVAVSGLATGDVLLAGVLVGVAVGDAVGGVAAVLACLAVVVRWGSSSLGAVGGDQAVLGWAGAVGPWAAALSSWCAAVALLLVPRRRSWPAVVACAALGALVVAGPTDAGGWWTRAFATALAVAAAFAADRLLPRRTASALSVAAALVAVALAVAA